MNGSWERRRRQTSVYALTAPKATSHTRHDLIGMGFIETGYFGLSRCTTFTLYPAFFSRL
jgi:hypothetical protein